MKTFKILNNVKAFEEFNNKHRKGHVFQSEAWANLKSDWKREVVAVFDGEEVVAGMSVLIRNIPKTKYTLMYCPRGPVCDTNDKESIKLLFDAAKALAKKHNSFEFKIDPDIMLSNTEFLDNMKAAGFILIDPKEEKFIQPRFVYRLDIEGETEESLQARFHHKTRYNIRLAQRKGVTVEICGSEKVDEFCRLLDITGQRDGFTSRSSDYFKKLLDTLGRDHARLYMAFYEGQAIAATIALQNGDKTWYLYGASDNEHRNVMPNYLLQMEMIRWAIESKCNIYDFRGVTDHTGAILQGLVTFKSGFDAKEVEFPGQFYVTYNKVLAKGLEIAMEGRKLLRKIKNRSRNK